MENGHTLHLVERSTDTPAQPSPDPTPGSRRATISLNVGTETSGELQDIGRIVHGVLSAVGQRTNEQPPSSSGEAQGSRLDRGTHLLDSVYNYVRRLEEGGLNTRLMPLISLTPRGSQRSVQPREWTAMTVAVLHILSDVELPGVLREEYEEFQEAANRDEQGMSGGFLRSTMMVAAFCNLIQRSEALLREKLSRSFQNVVEQLQNVTSVDETNMELVIGGMRQVGSMATWYAALLAELGRVAAGAVSALRGELTPLALNMAAVISVDGRQPNLPALFPQGPREQQLRTGQTTGAVSANTPAQQTTQQTSQPQPREAEGNGLLAQAAPMIAELTRALVDNRGAFGEGFNSVLRENEERSTQTSPPSTEQASQTETAAPRTQPTASGSQGTPPAGLRAGLGARPRTQTTQRPTGEPPSQQTPSAPPPSTSQGLPSLMRSVAAMIGGQQGGSGLQSVMGNLASSLANNPSIRRMAQTPVVREAVASLDSEDGPDFSRLLQEMGPVVSSLLGRPSTNERTPQGAIDLSELSPDRAAVWRATFEEDARRMSGITDVPLSIAYLAGRVTRASSGILPQSDDALVIGLMKSFRPRPSQAQGNAKSDWLLRLFDSQFFDAWLALTYIYGNETGGIHDYLCNKLYDLTEHKLELYLSQFCQLIVMRPGSSLERVIVDLCSKSLRIAVKVYWLFRAISQDQPKNKHAAELLDRCEKEALNGCWELPFKASALEPPPLTVDIKEDSAFMQTSDIKQIEQEESERSVSPVGGGSASISSSHDLVQGLEGLLSAALSRTYSGSQLDAEHVDILDTERSSATFERCRFLRQELGEGEGVSALLAKSCRNEAAGGSGCVAASENDDWMPSSPGLRPSTFGATLDFVDAICEASSQLVHLPYEARLKALKRALATINSEIDLCSANGLAVWFPMGSKNQRVLRLVPDETILLNSREKAPFLLLIEVMDTDAIDEDQQNPDQLYADSVQSINKTESPPEKSESLPEAELPQVAISEAETSKNSFSNRMDTALASLRGSAPLVRVHFDINEPTETESMGTPKAEETTESCDPSASLKEGAMSMMVSKFLQCSTTCINIGTAEEWFRRQVKKDKIVNVGFEVVGGVNLKIPSPSKKNRRVPSEEALEIVADKLKSESLTKMSAELSMASYTSSIQSVSDVSRELPQDEQLLRTIKKQKRAREVFGERWSEKEESVRRRSPLGTCPGWNLCRVVVKSGDDCRQELLAIQLIRTFQDIFLDARLPLWVEPYEVLVTSNRTALIEFIPDTLSVHSIKNRSSSGTTLSQHFFDKFIRGTCECATAQRNFVESLAAYSLITYLLQVKDRHNGNILMDDEGHIIHIDFGFMLSNSPGGVNFEAAPFKLTREYLEIMDSNSEGQASDLFDYFKVLCIQGFLVCRKHSDRILLLCDMMSKAGFPCFKGGDRALKALKRRFQLNIPEEQCVQVVIGAISDSLDAWRTRQYDYYQRVLNGIL